jgi:hypothetical protein
MFWSILIHMELFIMDKSRGHPMNEKFSNIGKSGLSGATWKVRQGRIAPRSDTNRNFFLYVPVSEVRELWFH